MKKNLIKRLFYIFISFLSFALICASFIKPTKAETPLNYETPDYISVGDLYFNSKTANKISMTTPTGYTYNKTTKYGSLVFSFKYINTIWSKDSDGVQIHFFSTWQHNGAFWLRPDAIRICYKDGDTKYIAGKSIKSGEHNVEVGRLAVLEDGEYKGKQYYYITIDNVKFCEYTMNNTDSNLISGNNIFLTGTNGNMIIDSNWTGNYITFMSNNEVYDSYKTMDEYITKPAVDPEIENKTFAGWFDKTGSEWDFLNSIVTGDLTLTAGFVTNNTGSDEEYFSDENFTPVLRFLVSSDCHIGKNTSIRDSRLKDVFDIAYEYSENNSNYNKLDAALFAGDLSDDGSETALASFKNIVDNNIKNGTALIVSMGNHEFNTYDSVTHEVMIFEDALDQSWDYHVVINGFHFIALSPNINSGLNFSETKVKWLEEQLEIAVNDNPNIPIFVMQHENIKGTVYGSTSWGMDELTDVLIKYPQVVDFSGHSHYPLYDPRTIWQGTFTAISTGTLHYYELGINGYKNSGVYPTDNTGGWSDGSNGTGSNGEFQIVEVDANNAIRVIVYDIDMDKEITRYYMRNIMDNIKLTYSHQERKKSAQKPSFSDANLTAIVKDESVEISFNQATSDDVVESYRIEFYKNDKLVRTEYALSDYFMDPIPERIKISVNGLDEESLYKIKVYAVNVWNMECDTPIETTFKTEKTVVYTDVVDEITLSDLMDAGGTHFTSDRLNSYKPVHFTPSENNMYGSFKLRMQLLYIGGDFQVCFNKDTNNDDMVWINNGNYGPWFIKENYRNESEKIEPGLHIVEYGRYHLSEGGKSYTIFYVKIDDTFYHEYKTTKVFTNDGYFSLNFNSTYAAGSRYYDIDYEVPKTVTPTFEKSENITLLSPITNWAYLGGALTFASKLSLVNVWLEDENGAITNKEEFKGKFRLGDNGDYYYYEIKTNSFELIAGTTGYESVTKICFLETGFDIGNVNVIIYQEEQFDVYDEISILDIGLPTTDGIYYDSELEYGFAYNGVSPSYSGVLKYYLVCGDIDSESEFRSQLGTLWCYGCSLWIQKGAPNYGFFGFNYTTRPFDKANINLESRHNYLVETGVMLVTEGEWAGWKYTYFKIDGKMYMEFYAQATECVSTSYAVAFKIKGNYKVADVSLARNIEYIVDDNVYYQTTGVLGTNIYEPKQPTKAGYYFTGWYTSPTGGERVNFNEVFNSIEDENVRYYARFSDSLGTVNFYSEGSLYESQEVGIGGFALKPTTPVKTGNYKYSFVKWVIKNTNNEYDFTTEITGDLDLEAVFEEYKYKIVYRVDGYEYTTRCYVESNPSVIIDGEPSVPSLAGASGYWDYSVNSRTAGDIYAISRYNGVTLTETSNISLTKFDGKEVDIADELTRYYLSFADTNAQKDWLFDYPVSGGHEKQNISFSFKDISNNTSYLVYFADNKDFTNAFIVRTKKTIINNVGIFEPGKTYYWKVVGEDTLTSSSVDKFKVINVGVRFISADTVYNMRDLGGWTTTNNKQIKYGMLYRGGQLRLDQSGEASYMSSYSYKVFDYLGIKTEIELRGETTHAYNQFNELEKLIYVNGQGYESLFTMNDEIKGYYREVFKALADESNYPFYFHCSWGADRTGSLAFLIEGVLGVPYEQLVEDYELTSLSYSGKRLREYHKFDYMYNTIYEVYGDGTTFMKAMENYLINYIGVKANEIQSLRNLMLVDATEQATTHKITYRINGEIYLESMVFDGGYASSTTPIYFDKHFSHWLSNGKVFDINTPISEDVILDAVFEKTNYESYDTVTVRDLGLTEGWVPRESIPFTYEGYSQNGSRIFEFDYKVVSATGTFNDGLHVEMGSMMWVFKAHLWLSSTTGQFIFTGGDGNPTVTTNVTFEYGKTYNIKFGVVIPIDGPSSGQKILILMIDDEVISYIPCNAEITGKAIGLSGTQGELYSVDNLKTITFMSSDGVTLIKQIKATRGNLLEPITEPTQNKKVFLGWYDELGNKWDYSKNKVFKDVTLFAKFGDSTVKALVMDDNDFEIIDDYQVLVGTKVSEIEAPKVNSSLEFDGWYNGIEKLKDEDVINENMELICRFKLKNNGNSDKPVNPKGKGCKSSMSIGLSLTALISMFGLLIKKKKENIA